MKEHPYFTNSKTKFSNPEELKAVLDDFFTQVDTVNGTLIPLSLVHLYTHLNLTWVTAMEIKRENKLYSSLLTSAENYCNLEVIRSGFAQDKSFARYFLDNYKTNPIELVEDFKDTQQTVVNISLDTRTREQVQEDLRLAEDPDLFFKEDS